MKLYVYIKVFFFLEMLSMLLYHYIMVCANVWFWSNLYKCIYADLENWKLQNKHRLFSNEMNLYSFYRITIIVVYGVGALHGI